VAGSIAPMFATLLGPMPRPALPEDAAPEALLDAVLVAQSDAGLEPLTDGGWPVPGADPVGAWRATQSRAAALVKAVVVGPISAGEPVETVRTTILGLADAGCAWIEVHEPAAAHIGADATAQARFAEAHQALTADLAGVEGLHLSLAITGGNADAAGIGTMLSGAYASLALDLIDGPDNWRLVAATPGDRGIVCGALSAHEGGDESPELLLYAAGYAASTGGRGSARVGLATSGSLADLSWDVAVRKLSRLGAGAKLAAGPPAERRAGLDPRAVDIQSAALGTHTPRPRRSSRPPRPSRPPGPPGEPRQPRQPREPRPGGPSDA
jgi:hypothetical protein